MTAIKKHTELIAKIVLSTVTLGISFGLIEIGYRFIDPYRKYQLWEVQQTKDKNLYQYDEKLG
jgi:hypothetical protein